MKNSEYRTEKDSLGDILVPRFMLYGAQTQRAVVNFPISGLRPWNMFIWSMAIIKRAAAEVNCELKLLDHDIAQAIIKAAEEVITGKWNNHFVVDPFQAGAGTSHNMNVNEVIANRATQIMGGGIGEYHVRPNDHVNMSQSTNDTIPTAIRLGCLFRLEALEKAIDELAQAFFHKSKEFENIIKSGRTHLQDAVPVTLGQEFSAYGLTLLKDRQRIIRAAEGLRQLGIGGTATGSGLNAHPNYHHLMVTKLSELTSLTLYSSDNLFERMQSMADMVDFSSSIRTLAVTLTRIANDLRLLSSGPATGLNEIILPAVQPGSSIMPGKINPVMAEMLNMSMFHIIGCDTTISLAAQAGQLELNVMMPVIAHNIFESMQIAIGSITAFTKKCVTGITANPEKTNQWLENNAIIATALNPLIGYNAAAALVKESLITKKTIREVAIEKAQANELQNINSGKLISAKEIENALNNLQQFTKGGFLS